ncbi:MAG TPA: helix-turn-helix transcriptional regulator [Clostridiales bacterium]|nr:helix-turn-helix transcriptional regulator [Clostridiales bacterium]
MTVGEKIKEARRQCGLSQQQLAEKMLVSRSAVAKWEAGNGLPDVDNVKALAQLLNVSIDYLLGEGEAAETTVLREAYQLPEGASGTKRKKKDRIVREKFPDADIYFLVSHLKLTKGERMIDNLIGFLTDAPFGIPALINSVKNVDKMFYLVEEENRQYLVMVTDEFIETRPLARRITDNKFEIGDWKFIKSRYKIRP